jgi:hypothetical protein
MYNHSLLSADRSTHLRIVLVPLIAATLFAIAAANVRTGDAGEGLRAERSVIVRAGHPAAYASDTTVTVR